MKKSLSTYWWVGCVIVAVAVTYGAVAWAAEDGGSSGWRLRGSMSAYTFGQGRLLAHPDGDLVNPGNSVLGIPRYQLVEDFRPVVKLDSDVGFSAVVKPRFQVVAGETKTAGVPAYGQQVHFELIEAYASAQIGEDVKLTAGAQNYQWGPGELFSPSNEMFRFFLENGTPLFYYRGRNVVRLNYTPRQDLSVDFVAEVEKNKDEPFQYGRDFARKAMLKAEKDFALSDTQSLNAAFIAGTDETQAHWLGQFAQVSLNDALSLYMDASENFRTDAWYADRDPNTGLVVMGQRTAGGLYARALGGLKYVFVGGQELRAEYLYNGLGYSRADGRAALDSLGAAGGAFAQQNLARALQPGLDFRGQHYAYTSLRIGDLGHQDKMTYFVRYLHSLTDMSGSAIVSAEYTPSQRWAIIAALMGQRGADFREFTLVERGRAQLAVRVDF